MVLAITLLFEDDYCFTFMSHDCLVYITIYTHAQVRTVVFPWTPNVQFILDIASDSKVFPTHHYELWISGERHINIICEHFQIYDFYTFFSLYE